MKKYNILIAHNYYQIPGGEDSVVKNEMNLLLENNHNVYLYTRHNNELKGKNKIKKIFLPIDMIFSLKTFIEVRKMIRENQIDIVHVHNTFPLISFSIYYASKSLKIPIVQTIHNFRFLCPNAIFIRDNKICEKCVKEGLRYSVKYKCYRNSFVQTLISAINLKIHRMIKTFNLVDAYICLTEFNKMKLSTIVKEEKIFIKSNFQKSDLIEEKIKSNDHFLFVGRIDEQKGIRLLLDAWREIKEYKLVIAGKGPLENEILQFIESNRINNIEFIGYQEKEEILELVRNSLALIVPSQWYEGFPMTIVESFSQGTPVIAGDIGNLSSIVEDNVNGLLFKYNDAKDLKKKIEMIGSQVELREKVSEGAITCYNLKYNEAINYNMLIKIYNQIYGGNYANL